MGRRSHDAASPSLAANSNALPVLSESGFSVRLLPERVASPRSDLDEVREREAAKRPKLLKRERDEVLKPEVAIVHRTSRMAKRVSQRQLALDLDVDRGFMARVELAHSPEAMTLPMIVQLCEELALPLLAWALAKFGYEPTRVGNVDDTRRVLLERVARLVLVVLGKPTSDNVDTLRAELVAVRAALGTLEEIKALLLERLSRAGGGR